MHTHSCSSKKYLSALLLGVLIFSVAPAFAQAATWLGDQQRVPAGYTGHAEPDYGLCYINESLDYGMPMSPQCINNSAAYNVGVFSAHQDGLSTGLTKIAKSDGSQVTAGTSAEALEGSAVVLEWSCLPERHERFAYHVSKTVDCNYAVIQSNWCEDDTKRYDKNPVTVSVTGSGDSGFNFTSTNLTGSVTVHPTVDTTYTLSCNVANAAPSPRTVPAMSIKVVMANVHATLTGPANVNKGESATLAWDVAQVTSCTIKDDAGNRLDTGSNTLPNLPTTGLVPYSLTDLSFSVPAKATAFSIFAQLWGAGGRAAAYNGSNGGGGGYAEGSAPAAAGNLITILTGQAGGAANTSAHGGGGPGYVGGGGRSALRISNQDVLTAGGGGGATDLKLKIAPRGAGGGAGGGLSGLNGAGGGGSGGTQTGGGSPDGGKYIGGTGVTNISTGGGGGGGGWFGGGGGGSGGSGGAGGGSGHCAPTVTGCVLEAGAGIVPGGKNQSYYQSPVGLGGVAPWKAGGNGQAVAYYSGAGTLTTGVISSTRTYTISCTTPFGPVTNKIKVGPDPCPTPLPSAKSNNTQGFLLPSDTKTYRLNTLGYNFCVTNGSAYDYFIPSKTTAEIKTFVDSIPRLSGVTTF